MAMTVRQVAGCFIHLEDLQFDSAGVILKKFLRTPTDSWFQQVSSRFQKGKYTISHDGYTSAAEDFFRTFNNAERAEVLRLMGDSAQKQALLAEAARFTADDVAFVQATTQGGATKKTMTPGDIQRLQDLKNLHPDYMNILEDAKKFKALGNLHYKMDQDKIERKDELKRWLQYPSRSMSESAELRQECIALRTAAADDPGPSGIDKKNRLAFLETVLSLINAGHTLRTDDETAILERELQTLEQYHKQFKDYLVSKRELLSRHPEQTLKNILELMDLEEKARGASVKTFNEAVHSAQADDKIKKCFDGYSKDKMDKLKKFLELRQMAYDPLLIADDRAKAQRESGMLVYELRNNYQLNLSTPLSITKMTSDFARWKQLEADEAARLAAAAQAPQPAGTAAVAPAASVSSPTPAHLFSPGARAATSSDAVAASTTATTQSELPQPPAPQRGRRGRSGL